MKLFGHVNQSPSSELISHGADLAPRRAQSKGASKHQFIAANISQLISRRQDAHERFDQRLAIYLAGGGGR